MRTSILVLVIGMIVHGSMFAAAKADKKSSSIKKTLSIGWGASSRMGRRPTMEDRYRVDGTAFGVFDGHRGSFAAQYAATHLLPRLQAAKGMDDYNKAFKETDQEIEAQDASGTTATIAIIKEEPHGYMLYQMRAGDSYSMLLGDRDPGDKIHYGEVHRPENVEEQARIKDADGSVYLDRSQGVARVTCPDASIVGLGVTRALGDRAWPNSIISPEPFISGQSLNPKRDRCLVIASDGVWDHLDDDLAEFIVQETSQDDTAVTGLADEQDREPLSESGNDDRAIRAARALCDVAYARGSDDNITAMVINFGWNDPAQSTAR